MKILVVGKPTYNVILPLNKFLLEGSKTKITEKLEMGGGSSFYCAYLLAKWGVSVHYTGVVGSDIYGAKIKADLDEAGVDTRYLETNYEHPTAFNYIVINETNGSSTQIIKENPEVNLAKYKYDFIPDIVIMDGTDMAGSLAAINNFPKAVIVVLANRVSDDVYSLTKKAHYVVASTGFAQALTKLTLEVNKAKHMVNFMQKIKDLNKADYTVMLREHGVLYSSDRQVKMIPAINIEKKIDDTHASNIFFGAYCYGLINNYGIDNAVKMANIAAGLSLTKLGSLNSVPSLEEVLTMAGIQKQSNVVKEETSAQPLEETTHSSTENQAVNIEANNSEPIPNTQIIENAHINQAFSALDAAPIESTPQVEPMPIPAPIPSVPAVNVQPIENANVINPAVNQANNGNIFDS